MFLLVNTADGAIHDASDINRWYPPLPGFLGVIEVAGEASGRNWPGGDVTRARFQNGAVVVNPAAIGPRPRPLTPDRLANVLLAKGILTTADIETAKE